MTYGAYAPSPEYSLTICFSLFASLSFPVVVPLSVPFVDRWEGGGGGCRCVDAVGGGGTSSVVDLSLLRTGEVDRPDPVDQFHRHRHDR